MDKLLLTALSTKQRYRSLKHAIPSGMISQETVAMLAWYGAYFEAFPEREYVVVD